MTLTRILKLIILGLVIYVGVQFAGAYVAKLQVTHILDTEAMEARRHKHSKKEIMQNIKAHMDRTNTELPYKMEATITGVGEPKRPLRIVLDYKHVVDLHVHKVVLDIQAVGKSEPAFD